MKKFLEEQETAAQPPEPRGEQTPYQAAERMMEEESGETMLDETMPEETDAEEEQVKWDGSEAELVADDSAAEYEEQQTGIKLKYSLSSKEIFYALIKTQYTPTRIALSVTAAILCVVTAVVFLVRMSLFGDPTGGLLAVVCAILFLIIIGMPAARIQLRSKKLADGNEIKMKIYPDHIQMGLAERQWEIPLDGTSERTIFRNLMILYIVGGKDMVILPLRCVEPTVLPEVQAMIFSGTEPKQ